MGRDDRVHPRDRPRREPGSPLGGKDCSNVFGTHTFDPPLPTHWRDVLPVSLPVEVESALRALARCNECFGDLKELLRHFPERETGGEDQLTSPKLCPVVLSLREGPRSIPSRRA